jgi:NTP pyrophosphatase (non-canonical NTP hydrolase)
MMSQRVPLSREEWARLSEGLTPLAGAIGAWRKGKGFETGWPNMMEKLMLVVTEIGEAAEAYRHQDRDNFAEEIADALIRLFDISDSIDLDIGVQLADKMVTNEGRPHKHGKVC